MKEQYYKLVGFAEALFGKSLAKEIEKPKPNDRKVDKRVQDVLFLHSIDRFNFGGYCVNLSNHQSS